MTPKKNSYARIRTTADLDKAIQAVHARRSKLEDGITRDANGLWKRYQPSHLVSGLVRHYSPLLSWTGIGLGLVRGARKIIAAPGKPKAAK